MPLSLWRPPTGAAGIRSELRREPAPMAATLTGEAPADFVRLVFLGDLCAGGGRAPEIDPSIVEALRSADLVIANCDAPVVRRPHLRLRSWLGQRRHMDAGALLGLVAAMGVEPQRLFLSVANDCALDQSVAGFEETLETLDALNIGVVGAVSRGIVQRIAIGCVTVGLVAFSDWRRGPRGRFRRRVITSDILPDNDWLAPYDAQPDVVCAFPHWGRRDTIRPGARTRERALGLAHKGVRLVAGHHQRMVQPVERIGDSHVAYGLGVFHGPPVPAGLARRLGAMLVVDIHADARRGEIAAYEMFPFLRSAEGGCGRIAALESLPPEARERAEACLAHVVGRHP